MRRVLAVVTVVAALVAPTAVASAHAATVPPSVAAAADSRTAPPTLHFRDKGPAVQILQNALRVPKVRAKGFFNRKTQRAVKAFQLRMGLRASGVVNAPTWAALGPRVSRAAARTVAAAPAGVLPWESFAARDLVGYRTSAYQGKYFVAGLEQYRICIVQREAGGVYRLGGYYQGAYQFAESWNSTIRAYLRPEMAAKYGQAGANAVDALADHSIGEWNRFWQDAAFYSVLAHVGSGPWAGGNWSCDSRSGRESGWPSAGAWNYLPFEG